MASICRFQFIKFLSIVMIKGNHLNIFDDCIVYKKIRNECVKFQCSTIVISVFEQNNALMFV